MILGASKPKQLKENLSVLSVVPLLTEKVIESIEKIMGTKPKLPAF